MPIGRGRGVHPGSSRATRPSHRPGSPTPVRSRARSASRRISDQRGARAGGRAEAACLRNATAAVLNVTGVNTTAPGFVTVYPAGTDLPTASNVNFDGAGQVMANMVTVKLGVGGAVDVYMQRTMDVAVDVSGAYVPVSGPVARAAW